MKTRIALMVGLVGGIAAIANAQQPQVNGSNVAYNFSWQDNGNNNGILEPGEAAVISLSISMTPAANAPITWNTVIGGSGTGVFRGLQAMFFDLVGGATATGNWTNLGVPNEVWDLVGPPGYGTPANSGSRLNNIQAGQFPPTQPSVNTSNPIENIWTGTWTPTSYAARTENFVIANGSANPNPFPSFVIVRDTEINSVVLVGTSAHSGGGFSIPIVPAPSSLALLGLGGLVAARRRR